MFSRIWVIAAFVSISTTCYAASLSGTYVGTGPGVAILLQVVETKGGQLSGRYEQAKLVPGPKIERYSGVAKGSVDGETVVLEWKSTDFLSTAVSVSGSANQASLTLSGLSDGATFTMHLARSTEDAFRSQVALLTEQLNEVDRARVTAETIKRLDAIAQLMTAFNSAAPTELKNFLPLERQFQAQTAAMSSALVREQTIVRNDNTAVVRGQIDGAINQAQGASTQLHLTLQSAATEFQSKILALGKEIGELSAKCKTAKAEAANNAKPVANLMESCLKVNPIAAEFGNQVTKVLAGYQHAEAVWQQESQKQQSIVSSSNIASR